MKNFFENLKVKYKLMVIYFSSFFIILSISGFFIYSNVKEQIEHQIQRELSQSIDSITKIIETLSKDIAKKELKLMALKNKAIVDYYYSLYKNNELTKTEALHDLKKIFAKQIIGKSGYLAIIHNDKKNKKITMPVHPFISSSTDVSNNKVVQDTLKIKNGYYEYLWKNKDEKLKRKKALYVSYYDAWDFAVVATEYLSELSEVIDIKDLKHDIESYKIGITGYVYIINSNAQIIHHPFINDINSAIQNNELKLIFIAGNEPFTQGDVDYSTACRASISKGIIVNTIFCGNHQEGIQTNWKDGADLADGKYMNIDQNQRIVHIDAPQDEELIKLGKELNKTYIAYGKSGVKSKDCQSGQDLNALSISKSKLVVNIVLR